MGGTVAQRSLESRLAALPRYPTCRDVITIAFADDEDAFVDAYCDGSLSSTLRKGCAESLGDTGLSVMLLRRMVRLLGVLVSR